MTHPYSSATRANVRSGASCPSRTAWSCFALFGIIHTLVMLPVGVDGYGVPIPSLILWMFIDFPISWVIMFGVLGFDLPDAVLKASLLVGGGLQWGLLGWLCGRLLTWLGGRTK